MKNDDLWQLDGKAGPALPLSDEALHRLVDDAVGRVYGAQGKAPVSASKAGQAGGLRLFAGVGVAACVTIGALFAVGGSTQTAPVHPSMSVPTSEVNDGPSPPVTSVASGLPTVDVQALPEAPNTPDRAPRAIASSPQAARDLLREANRLRAERRWNDAAALYRRVADARTDESTTAMLALASLRLEHQNDAREARRLYRAVVDAEPGGPLAEEARWGVAMACRALGDDREESIALRTFLAHHASSLSAPKAQKRLTELDASQKEVTP